MTDPDFINPIWPGFAWEQQFTLAADMAPVGAVLRIVLTPEGQTRSPGINLLLTRPEATRHVMTLTAEQTATLRAPGAVWGDFVVRAADGTETPLNLRLSIPVELSLTPASGGGV